jgi:hypothetical protein
MVEGFEPDASIPASPPVKHHARPAHKPAAKAGFSKPSNKSGFSGKPGSTRNNKQHRSLAG